MRTDNNNEFSNHNSQSWSNDVVFKVYCNDDLHSLPLGILKQMKEYIESVIENKREVGEDLR